MLLLPGELFRERKVFLIAFEGTLMINLDRSLIILVTPQNSMERKKVLMSNSDGKQFYLFVEDGFCVTVRKSRHFAGGIGLDPNVGDVGGTKDNLLVFSTWQNWARARSEEGKTIVGNLSVMQAGMSANIFQPVRPITTPVAPATTGEPQNPDSLMMLVTRPVAPIVGEITGQQENLPDAEVIETLTSLFSAIAIAFGQTETQFMYWGQDGIRKSYHIEISDQELECRTLT